MFAIESFKPQYRNDGETTDKPVFLNKTKPIAMLPGRIDKLI